MSAKKIKWVFAGLLISVLSAVIAIGWALQTPPEFYEQALADEPAPEVRRQAAKKLVQQALRLVDDIKHSDSWSEQFSEQQINSWLAEELHQKYAEWVPQGVYDPRVNLDDDLVRIGFRFEHERWQGIVSVEVKPWVPQPNQLALQIQSIRAGLVPIPLQDVLEEVSSRFEAKGRHVRWTQQNGYDVAIVQLEQQQADGPTLKVVKVTSGELSIGGDNGKSSQPSNADVPQIASDPRLDDGSVSEE